MALEQPLTKAKEANHSWLPAIGTFQKDQVFEDWQPAIQDYCRSADEDCL